MADDNVRQFPRRRLEPFEVVYPPSLEGTEPTPVRWLIRNAVPRGTVCLFSGDSGLGKSLLMLQLQAATALRKPWLGFDVEPCKSFGFYCEDPENVIHLRIKDICQHYDVTKTDLEDISYTSRVGSNNVLMDFNRRTDEGKTTPVFDQIMSHVREFGAQLLIIDTLAHTFNGNEIIRNQVTAFVSALQKIATEMDGAVILTSHPSVAGMQSGTGISGSTAWRATVRAQMYIKRPKAYDDEAQDADQDERILKTMKSNWGAAGGVTRIRWDQGVFVTMAPERVPVSSSLDRLTVDHAVLEAARFIVKRGDKIATGTMHQRCLAALASHLPSCATYRRQDMNSAVDRLLEAGKLIIVEVGRGTRRYPFLRPSEMRYPGEEPNG